MVASGRSAFDPPGFGDARGYKTSDAKAAADADAAIRARESLKPG